jgi:hypothetical protein
LKHLPYRPRVSNSALPTAPFTVAISTPSPPQGQQNSDEPEDGSSLDDQFTRALLLCFFASHTRSLFAARCLVESVLEAHRRGYTLDDLKLTVALAGLQNGGKLLNSVDEDVLLAWAAIVMMTARLVGLKRYPEGDQRVARRAPASLEEEPERMTQGLRAFVLSCMERFLAGTDLYRLQLQQSMAGESRGRCSQFLFFRSLRKCFMYLYSFVLDFGGNARNSV